MLIEAALALEIQRINPRLQSPIATQYAAWVVEESRDHHVDPWVVFALVVVESRWTARAFRREGDGTCSVGLGQINVSDCDPIRIQYLFGPKANLHSITVRLELLKRTCRRDCDGIRWLRGYNPGSRTYVSKVERALLQREIYEDRESDIRDVPSEVYPTGMCGARSP